MNKHFLITAIVYTLSLCISAQTAGTFRGWGDDLLDRLNQDFKTNSRTYLYDEYFGQTEVAYAWPTSIILKALIYAGKIDDAEKLFTEFHNNYYYTGNGYPAYNAVCNGHNDRYYDDNAWIAKDLMDLYEATNNEQYLIRARIINTFCMSGERAEGGIRFHEKFSAPTHSEYNNWAICATAPVTCVNLRLYKATKEVKYLEDAKRLYHFMKDDTWGIGPGYRAYENAVVMQAALLLYQLTGEKTYLSDTYNLAYSIESRYIAWQKKQLHETGCWGGHDMADAYVALYQEDNDPRWLNIVSGYLRFLHDYCKDKNGYYPMSWNDTSKDCRRTEDNGDRRYHFIDQASAVCAFYRMSLVPEGNTPPAEPAAIFEKENYNNNGLESGWSIGLNPGEYSKDTLAFLGLTTNRFGFSKDISSLRVQTGYKIILYDEDLFAGNSKEYTSNKSMLGDWNDRTVSLKVIPLNSAPEKNSFDGLTMVYPTQKSNKLTINGITDEVNIQLFDLSGKSLYSRRTTASNHAIDMVSFPCDFYILFIDSKEKRKVVKFRK